MEYLDGLTEDEIEELYNETFTNWFTITHSQTKDVIHSFTYYHD
jgi:hypothetical protein